MDKVDLPLIYSFAIKYKMDQFDDLPDVVEKDTKPTFQTEVHNNGPSSGISNGLQPLFAEESTTTHMAYKDPGFKEDPEDADDKIEHPEDQEEH